MMRLVLVVHYVGISPIQSIQGKNRFLLYSIPVLVFTAPSKKVVSVGVSRAVHQTSPNITKPYIGYYHHFFIAHKWDILADEKKPRVPTDELATAPCRQKTSHDDDPFLYITISPLAIAGKRP